MDSLLKRKYAVKFIFGIRPRKQDLIYKTAYLKPCPICGGTKISIFLQDGDCGIWFLIKCEICNLQKPVLTKYCKQIESEWNWRVHHGVKELYDDWTGY